VTSKRDPKSPVASVAASTWPKSSSPLSSPSPTLLFLFQGSLLCKISIVQSLLEANDIPGLLTVYHHVQRIRGELTLPCASMTQPLVFALRPRCLAGVAVGQGCLSSFCTDSMLAHSSFLSGSSSFSNRPRRVACAPWKSLANLASACCSARV
jgi:hypothetical protein